MHLDVLTAFGLAAVIVTLICYAMEERAHWWTLGFSFCCFLSAVYGFLQGAWPIGGIELIWTAVAFRRWLRQRRAANTV